MKLIVGLGNPGRQYAQTRHNVGFMALEALAQRHQLTGPRKRFHGATLEGMIADDKCVLLQPTTFMNRSGQAVGEALNFYQLEKAALLVVVDDTALPCGRMRIRPEGSAGGHNGLRDIERALGGADYPRLRLGVDAAATIAPDQPGPPQRDYVLARFTPEQRAVMDKTLPVVCDAIECWVRDGIEAAMNRFNAWKLEG